MTPIVSRDSFKVPSLQFYWRKNLQKCILLRFRSRNLITKILIRSNDLFYLFILIVAQNLRRSIIVLYLKTLSFVIKSNQSVGQLLSVTTFCVDFSKRTIKLYLISFLIFQIFVSVQFIQRWEEKEGENSIKVSHFNVV